MSWSPPAQEPRGHLALPNPLGLLTKSRFLSHSPHCTPSDVTHPSHQPGPHRLPTAAQPAVQLKATLARLRPKTPSGLLHPAPWVTGLSPFLPGTLNKQHPCTWPPRPLLVLPGEPSPTPRVLAVAASNPRVASPRLPTPAAASPAFEVSSPG